MNRLLYSLIFVLLAMPSRAGAEDLIYSEWAGGCWFGEIADISCLMRREARSVTGGRLGYVVFGRSEISRFLFIEVELPASTPELSLVTKIDGDPLAGGGMFCLGNERYCSVILLVDDDLLNRLAAGKILIVESQDRGDIEIHFPLLGFQKARARLF